MLDIFSSIPIRAQDITGNLIHVQIQLHERELFTGLFHISGNGQSAFLFAEGKLISVYRFFDEHWSNLAANEWEELISESSGVLRVATLTVEGVRLFRLFFESDFSESKTVPSLPSSELNSFVNSWQRGDKAGLVMIRQSDASVLMLFPARQTVFTDAVIVDSVQTQAGSTVSNQIKSWRDRPCEVSTCTYDAKSEAWKEYSLRVSFGQFTQSILRRYSDLAGHFLVTDLNEQVNNETKNWGLALSIYGTDLSNRQFFETTDQAASVYVTIFNMIGKQMKAVVGEKMATSIYQDAVMQLELDNRALVQDYVISKLGQDMRERV